MAKASEQFRQADATIWGIVALVTCGIAVMGANLSALVPSSALGGLHRTRIEGFSLEQLRLQVADLREQTVELSQENSQLLTRFALKEQQSNEVVQRVGALEVSLPRLLEVLPDKARIDRSTITSSITQDEPVVFDAEGGSVAIRRRPMPEAMSVQPDDQPIPALATAAMTMPVMGSFGVALGTAVSPELVDGTWRDLSMKLGPLLLGLNPIVADDATGSQRRIIVGPIAEVAAANALCGRLERISISCMPVPYAGTPLADPTTTQ